MRDKEPDHLAPVRLVSDRLPSPETTAERETKLARARSYPYGIPAGSYMWRGGTVAPFDPTARKGRTPVLAVGSNQSPEQLTRKFGDCGEIPVQRARLADFDVYYSAHITAYGAVPAILQYAPGTLVMLSVTWLDDGQLDLMHESELGAGNYWYGAIEDIDLALDCGTRLGNVTLYVGVHGQLMHEGEAIALTAITAERRHPRALATADVLEIVRERVSPLDSADEFVLKLVGDEGFRAACTAALAADAVPFAHLARKLTT